MTSLDQKASITFKSSEETALELSVVFNTLAMWNVDIRAHLNNFDIVPILIEPKDKETLKVTYDMECLSQWFQMFAEETGKDGNVLAREYLDKIQNTATKMGLECADFQAPEQA